MKNKALLNDLIKKMDEKGLDDQAQRTAYLGLIVYLLAEISDSLDEIAKKGGAE